MRAIRWFLLPRCAAIALSTAAIIVVSRDPGATESCEARGCGSQRASTADIDTANNAVALAVFDSLAARVSRGNRALVTPPAAGLVSSVFSHSRWHPIWHVARPHHGIDIAAALGAPILAPAAGLVTRVAVEDGYGKVVEIDHENGLLTRYAHCSQALVIPGQRVERGQLIATVGNTGLSTGPHLHYEIWLNGRVVDPLTYINIHESAYPTAR